jgi:outer membrane protein TolC
MRRSDLVLDGNVRVVPVEGGLSPDSAAPETEDAAVSSALANSAELKRLHSTLAAKEYSLRAERAAYLPRVDMVAQYALLGEYNNYSDFFKTFQRNNGQLGMSFQVPVIPRTQVEARMAPIQSEIAQVKIQLTAAQSSLGVETRRLFREVRQAESAHDLARMELDLARETLSVLLARLDEGRVSVSEVEQARLAEAQRWEAFYDAQSVTAKARLNLLREAGLLISAMQ